MNGQITVLKDESLGGTLREYREVKRKANVGELVKITDNNCGHHFASGEIVRIRSVNTAEYLDKRDWWADKEVDYVVLEPTDVIVLKPGRGVRERFRMVDRKAAVGERVIVTQIDYKHTPNETLAVGQIGECTEEGGWDDASIDTTLTHDSFGFLNADRVKYSVLEPVESEALTAADSAPLSTLPLADQYAENITVLTRKIAELESRILALETDSAVSVVKVAEGHVDNALPAFSQAPKSPQMIRDEIVERAKADLVKLADAGGHYTVDRFLSTTAEFVVDRDKRKVTVILRGYNSGKTRAVGRSKCAPGETFNTHIGRAIALYRALGLEVPAEYLNAPGPGEVRVGDVVTFEGVSGYGTLYEVLTLDAQGENLRIIADEYAYMIGEGARGGELNDGVASIIDDSREDNGVTAVSSPSAPRKEAA